MDNMNAAFVIIRDRICSSTVYTESRKAVIQLAASICRGKSVEEMKELGGFTAVVTRAIQTVVSLDPRTEENMGSKLIPMTVADALRQDIPMMRGEAQRLTSRMLLFRTLLR